MLKAMLEAILLLRGEIKSTNLSWVIVGLGWSLTIKATQWTQAAWAKKTKCTMFCGTPCKFSQEHQRSVNLHISAAFTMIEVMDEMVVIGDKASESF